ncbi:MAG: polysaccharide biosynthesis tyrosine autokinase [Micromonosporaceae bacterium]|nr:polysaccharide biosynthesis tyrosine autokinase [Micromonosporaceae bacterium]
MDLRTALRVLREHWLLIVATTVLALLAGAAVTWQQTPRYTAKVTLFVSAWGTTGDTSSAYQGGLLSQQRVKSYTELLRGERVMESVARELQLDLSPAKLASKITATVVTDTALLTVTAEDTSPTLAQAIANTTGDQFVRLIPEFESAPEGKQVPVRVTVINRATRPASPTSPQPVRNLILAAVLGLFAGFAAAMTRNALDTTVKTAQELVEASGAPLLGAVPFDPKTPKNPLVLNGSPYAPRAEAIRKIRTNLQFLNVDRLNKVILVTSPAPGGGKSTTACNLAITTAESGKRVLLIDADLRRPRASRYLGLPAGVGLTSVLVGTTAVEPATQRWGDDLFSVLASGPVPPNPSELLGSQQMQQLLWQLRERYDLIIVDGPPVLPVADALAVAHACDGVVLLAQHATTTRHELNETATALRAVEAPLLGAVLNMVPIKGGHGYYDYRTDDAPAPICRQAGSGSSERIRPGGQPQQPNHEPDRQQERNQDRVPASTRDNIEVKP